MLRSRILLSKSKPDIPGIDTSKMKQSNLPATPIQVPAARFLVHPHETQSAEVLRQKDTHIAVVVRN